MAAALAYSAREKGGRGKLSRDRDGLDDKVFAIMSRSPLVLRDRDAERLRAEKVAGGVPKEHVAGIMNGCRAWCCSRSPAGHRAS